MEKIVNELTTLSSSDGADSASLSIVNIEWRIDVLLASDSLNRIGVPVVLLQVDLSDGRSLNYRLTQEELHQWRFTLAKLVRDLGYLEKKRPPAAVVSKAAKQYQNTDE